VGCIPFCRVVLTTSSEWGAVVTKLNVPADWKGLSLSLSLSLSKCFGIWQLLTPISVKHAEWQIYLLLLGMFLASAVAFYGFFQHSDSFWNFPLGRNQPARPILGDPQSSDDLFGPLDM
jgi:prolactin regulatory element-binding protein